MKHKLSISLDQDTIMEVQKAILHSHQWRNTSHFLEVAARKLLEENTTEKP